jgi:hypothetical protein
MNTTNRNRLGTDIFSFRITPVELVHRATLHCVSSSTQRLIRSSWRRRPRNICAGAEVVGNFSLIAKSYPVCRPTGHCQKLIFLELDFVSAINNNVTLGSLRVAFAPLVLDRRSPGMHPPLFFLSASTTAVVHRILTCPMSGSS